MPSESDGIAAVEMCKELSEGVGTMRSKEENVIDKSSQRLCEVKEILFKETHKQVCIGRGCMCAHGGSFYLEVMPRVEGEMFVGENKLFEFDKELNGC